MNDDIPAMTQAESAEKRVYEAVKSAMSYHPTTSGNQDHLIALACQDVTRRMLEMISTTIETED